MTIAALHSKIKVFTTSSSGRTPYTEKYYSLRNRIRADIQQQLHCSSRANGLITLRVIKCALISVLLSPGIS